MPAIVRIMCKYNDCKFLDGLYCGNTEVEIDPKKFCLTYIPEEDLVDMDSDGAEVDEETDDESLEELEEWEDDEESDDPVAPGYNDE